MPNQLWILGGGGAETHSQANRLENKFGLFSTIAFFVYILFPSTVVFLRWFTFCKTFCKAPICHASRAQTIICHARCVEATRKQRASQTETPICHASRAKTPICHARRVEATRKTTCKPNRNPLSSMQDVGLFSRRRNSHT